MARELDCSRHAISEWRWKQGLPRNRTCTLTLNTADMLALAKSRTDLLGLPERKIEVMVQEPEIACKGIECKEVEIACKDNIRKLNDAIQKANVRKADPDIINCGCPNFDLDRWKWRQGVRKVAKTLR